ncbi:MAG: 4-hydroxythreonine-4-phosphate dehydrogenase PdxA [Polyangia bacterium]|jgi:4-hydroxythreonine-4-phosphate dehydrogenase|nr:4-hydroxythreonine-4-phosphate dehydrogenase PdxA [Polyangia bacterium]
MRQEIEPFRLHITLGDPTGIGPEVIARALSHWEGPPPVIHGHLCVLERLGRELGLPVPGRDLPAELRQPELPRDPFAEPGIAQREALVQAVEAAGRGEVDALCTAPVDKASLSRAGFAFPGHTDFLAAAAGARVAMLFVAPTLRVALSTVHLPLSEVPQALTRERIVETILLGVRALEEDFGLARPRVAVAGLNPHAGEGGLLGHEEGELFEPALAEARESLAGTGLEAELSGPWPADTVFLKAHRGRFDLVVASYHDQGLIPVKLLAPSEAVNVTIGLPYVRTSPAHGTAPDIAWTGKADPRSTIEALRLALELGRRRRARRHG